MLLRRKIVCRMHEKLKTKFYQECINMISVDKDFVKITFLYV